MTLLPSRSFSFTQEDKHKSTHVIHFFQLTSSFAHPALAQLAFSVVPHLYGWHHPPSSLQSRNLGTNFNFPLPHPLKIISLKALLVLSPQILVIFLFTIAADKDIGEDMQWGRHWILQLEEF